MIISVYGDTNVLFLRAWIVVWIFTLKPCRYVAVKPTVSICAQTRWQLSSLGEKVHPEEQNTKTKGAPPKPLLKHIPWIPGVRTAVAVYIDTHITYACGCKIVLPGCTKAKIWILEILFCMDYRSGSELFWRRSFRFGYVCYLLIVTVNQYDVHPACDHPMVVERKENILKILYRW